MYKKTIIRQYFATLLKSVLSIDNRVYSGRIDPLNNTEYPYVTVFNKSENIVEQFTSHTERELELKIGVVVKQNQTQSADFDEVIEGLMYEVESVMGRVLSVQAKELNDNYALFEDIVLEGTATDSDNSSGDDIGGGMMTYKISYNYELPIVPLVLEDFDWQGSIDNLKITNEGIPND